MLKVNIVKREFKLPKSFSEYKILEDYLPEDKEEAQLEFTDVNPSICNAFRRIITDEIPVKILDAEITSITTNSSFTSDLIRQRLNQIPIRNKGDTLITGELHVENKEQSRRIVTNKDLYLRLDGKEYIPEDHYRLLVLRSGESVKIKDIHTVEVKGNVGIPVENLTYEINKNKCMITFNTVGILTVREILAAVFNILNEKLEGLLEFLESDKVTTDNYELTTIDVDMYNLRFNNERFTLGAMLTWAVYEQDSSITLVKFKLLHVSESKGDLVWIHSSGKKIIIAAVKKLIKIINDMS